IQSLLIASLCSLVFYTIGLYSPYPLALNHFVPIDESSISKYINCIARIELNSQLEGYSSLLTGRSSACPLTTISCGGSVSSIAAISLAISSPSLVTVGLPASNVISVLTVTSKPSAVNAVPKVSAKLFSSIYSSISSCIFLNCCYSSKAFASSVSSSLSSSYVSGTSSGTTLELSSNIPPPSANSVSKICANSLNFFTSTSLIANNTINKARRSVSISE